MVQLSLLERLATGGLQAFLCFYQLENWLVRYDYVFVSIGICDCIVYLLFFLIRSFVL